MSLTSIRFIQRNITKLNVTSCFYSGITVNKGSLSPLKLQQSSLNNNNNKRFYCSVNNNINNESQQQQPPKEQQQKEQQKEQFNRDKILETSLQFVNLYGWTSEAVSKACVELGYPPVTQGIIGENSGYELALYFVKKSNQQVFTQLTGDLLNGLSKKDKIKFAVKLRLSMIKPYITRWSEAMQLLAHPTHLQTTLPTMQTLVDDIWFSVGDRSSDFDWYAKRGLMAALYTSSELFMLTDTSPEFLNTMRYVDDRVEDLIKTIKFKNDCESTISMAVGTLLNTIHKTK